MRNCLLCDKTPADKTGSHIVPHFLSKRIDNEPGQSGRDKEIGFVITQDSTTSYFGRAVQPEKLEEIFGEITDELIDGNDIEGIVDNYFCWNCEANLALIENEYAITLGSNSEIDKNYISLKKPFVGFLFWISIVWRLSIQERSGFKLKLREERKLGRVLKHYLKSNIDEIKPDKENSDLNDIGYKLIRAPNFSNENSTVLHWSAFFERPYSVIIDEFLLFFYFKKAHVTGVIADFYGSEKHKQKAIFNTPFEPESAHGLSFDNYKAVKKNLMLSFVRARRENLGKKLDIIHQKHGGNGKQMHHRLKNEILNRIANSEVELGHKHTTENYIKVTMETLTEFNKA